MLPIRQGATHKVVIGPAVAVGDGFTPVASLSLSTADDTAAILHDNATVVDISGYTMAAITNADGYYHLTLQSGISNTVGHLTIVIQDDSLILPLKADFAVVEEAVYDMLYAGSAIGYVANASVNAAQVGGQTASASGTVTFPGTIASTTNITGGTITTVTNLTNAPTSGDFTSTMKTSLETAAGNSLTAYDPATGTDITTAVGGLNDVSTSEINGIVLPYVQLLARKDSAIATDNSTQLDAINADESSGAGAYSNITDSLEATSDTKATATALATAQTDLDTITGSDGVTLATTQGNYAPATTAGLATAQADLDTITGSDGVVIASGTQTFNMTGSITGNLSGSVGSVTGAVGSVTGNVGGNVVGSVASVTAGVTLANDAITAAKFDESTAFPITSADTSSTRIARTGADSDTLETISDEIAALENLSQAEAQAAAEAALAAYDAPTNTDLTSGLAGLNDVSTAEVNAEIVDALATDTYAEPGTGALPATTSIANKVGYLYKLTRNKKDNDGSVTSFYADDASTVHHTQTTDSSGGTVTKGEISGP